MGGWIVLHRELLDKAIWENSTPEQGKILIALLLMANHMPKQWEWNGVKFECQAGQFVTSLEKIAQKAGKGISTQNVRTALKRFEKYGFLTNESTKTGRLISIVNWEHYQRLPDGGNKGYNKDLTKSQQRPNKELTPNNNDNNDNNETKEKDIYVRKFPPGSFEMRCVDLIIQSTLEVLPKSKVPKTDKQLDKWCEDINKLIRLDGYTEEETTHALQYAITSDFWKKNIRSAGKFREKIETLILQSKDKRSQKRVAPAQEPATKNGRTVE